MDASNQNGLYGLGSAAISAMGSLGSSALSYRAQKKLAQLQYEYQLKLSDNQYKLNQKSLRESPSATREGLLNAGYNPLLAVTNPTSSPTVGLGSASVPSFDADLGDLGAAFDRGFNSAVSRRKQEAEVKRMDKLTNAEYQRLRAEADAALANSGAAMYDAETRRAESAARIKNLNAQTDSIVPTARKTKDIVDAVSAVGAPVGSALGVKTVNQAVRKAVKAIKSNPSTAGASAGLLSQFGMLALPLVIGAGSGAAMHKAQSDFRRDKRKSFYNTGTYTNHMSAGW